jgi:hypothetical protein
MIIKYTPPWWYGFFFVASLRVVVVYAQSVILAFSERSNNTQEGLTFKHPSTSRPLFAYKIYTSIKGQTTMAATLDYWLNTYSGRVEQVEAYIVNLSDDVPPTAEDKAWIAKMKKKATGDARALEHGTFLRCLAYFCACKQSY